MASRRPARGWEPRSPEDRMLAAWLAARGPAATAYAELRLAGSGRKSPWKSSRRRRLDALLAHPAAEPGVLRRQAFAARMREGPAIESVELLEIDHDLDEEAIGRALVSVCLWGGQHEIPIGRTILLAASGDPALAWCCTRLGVELEVVAAPARRRRQRPGQTGSDAQRIARLDPWRRGVGGTFVTGVPIADKEAGVAAWEGARERRVSLLRVADGPIDALVLFDTVDRFLALVDERPVDLVVFRPTLSRGAIGEALCHALLLTEQYEVPLARRVIVCERGDEALEWACAKLGIVVERTAGAT